LTKEIDLLFTNLNYQVLLKIFKKFHGDAESARTDENEQDHHVEVAGSPEQSPEKANIIDGNSHANVDVGVLFNDLVDEYAVEHAELKHHDASQHFEISVFHIFE
jgi:hypothetical protein